jgi:uncharacterized membrane protein
MFPKSRIDALNDGIFAVAMTVLVLDIRLPEGLDPKNPEQLQAALLGASTQFLPYVISFMVLGMRWLANVESHRSLETVDRRWARLWLCYMLFITCVPFSTYVIGRHPGLAPAVWLYATNTLLIGLIGLRMLAISKVAKRDPHLRPHQTNLVLLVVMSILAIGVSFVLPAYAIWVFALMAFSALTIHLSAQRTKRSPA